MNSTYLTKWKFNRQYEATEIFMIRQHQNFVINIFNIMFSLFKNFNYNQKLLVMNFIIAFHQYYFFRKINYRMSVIFFVKLIKYNFIILFETFVSIFKNLKKLKWRRIEIVRNAFRNYVRISCANKNKKSFIYWLWFLLQLLFRFRLFVFFFDFCNSFNISINDMIIFIKILDEMTIEID